MSILNIINPWGRIAALKHELDGIYVLLGQRDAQIIQQDARITELERELRLRESLAAADKREYQRLTKLISEGHFRNPATGRLGRKGQVFN